MTKIILSLGAASMLALSAAAFAEQQLSGEQMDSVTAGGLAAAFATSAALGGPLAFTQTVANTGSAVLATVPVQVGSIAVVGSFATAGSVASTGGFNGLALGQGATIGEVHSDTVSYSNTVANKPGGFVLASASNTSIGSSYATPAASLSAASAASILGN